MFGSEWLIEQLSRLGFSISYGEVTLFRQSVMQDPNFGQIRLPEIQSSITQFSCDNADANVDSLSGDGNFHGMGTIAWYKKEPKRTLDMCSVKRMARLKVSDLTQDRGIPQLRYITSALGMSNIKFKPIHELLRPLIVPPSLYYSQLLWRSTSFSTSQNVPEHWINWSGCMQHIFKSSDADSNEDEVVCLPLIDMDPNDENCIYSAIMFIVAQLEKMAISATSVTFDQPLFSKALEVVESKDLGSKIVLRLGRFHTLMSAIGAVFHTMKGSGIEACLEEIFGSNTVVNIMCGKKFNRAVRAIHLLSAALNFQIIHMIVSTDLNDDGLSHAEVAELMELLSTQNQSIDQTITHEVIDKLDRLIMQKKALLSNRRTGRLWVQFMDYLSLLEEFIASERLGLWHSHLDACVKLLNVFAATGHLHYAKSARIYVQRMDDLPDTHPHLYQSYVENGRHAVYRSDHCFNSIWSDLTIEQVCMKGIKSPTSGLTHGRSLTESVRLHCPLASLSPMR